MVEGIIEKIKKFFSKLQPGILIVREYDGMPNHVIYQYVNTDDLDIRVFEIGGIGINFNGVEYVDFIYNTKHAGLVKIRKGTFRLLNKKEKKLVKKSLIDPRYKSYLTLAKEHTNLNIKI